MCARRAWLWAFVAFLLLAYLGNLGQVPPGVTAVAVVGLLGSAISLLWIWWFDRNRDVRLPPEAGATPAASAPNGG